MFILLSSRITFAYETVVIETMEPIMLYTKLVILLYSILLNLYAYDITCPYLLLLYNMPIRNMILGFGTPLHAYFVSYVNSCVPSLFPFLFYFMNTRFIRNLD